MPSLSKNEFQKNKTRKMPLRKIIEKEFKITQHRYESAHHESPSHDYLFDRFNIPLRSHKIKEEEIVNVLFRNSPKFKQPINELYSTLKPYLRVVSAQTHKNYQEFIAEIPSISGVELQATQIWRERKPKESHPYLNVLREFKVKLSYIEGTMGIKEVERIINKVLEEHKNKINRAPY